MIETPTIIITGANGFIGKALVGYFSQKGWNVRALVRAADTRSNSKHVSYYEYDMAKPPSELIFDDADFLVHAAYAKDAQSDGDAFKLNLSATRQLLGLSRKHQLRRAVFLSSMSSQPDAVSVYGKQKYAIEKLFNTSVDVVLRLGLVLGNGGLAQRMASFMRSNHVVPLVGGGDQPLQFVGIHDVCRSIEQVLHMELSGVLTIATPEVYSYREFYLALRSKLHIRAILVPIPFWILLFAIRLAATLRIPLAVNEENLQGLKKLRPADSLPDLRKLNITLDNLYELLEKKTIV